MGTEEPLRQTLNADKQVLAFTKVTFTETEGLKFSDRNEEHETKPASALAYAACVCVCPAVPLSLDVRLGTDPWLHYYLNPDKKLGKMGRDQVEKTPEILRRGTGF